MLRSIIVSAASARSLVDVGHRVAGHRDLVVAHVGVQRAVEDALLGDLAGQHQVADLPLSQQVVQRASSRRCCGGP